MNNLTEAILFSFPFWNFGEHLRLSVWSKKWVWDRKTESSFRNGLPGQKNYKSHFKKKWQKTLWEYLKRRECLKVPAKYYCQYPNKTVILTLCWAFCISNSQLFCKILHNSSATRQKGRISKQLLQENKARQIFGKQLFLTLWYARTLSWTWNWAGDCKSFLAIENYE